MCNVFPVEKCGHKWPENMFSNFWGEMWCNTDKVQWKTEVRRQTQRVICEQREEGDKNKDIGSDRRIRN